MALVTDGGQVPKYAATNVTLSMSWADQPPVLRGERRLASATAAITGPDSALTLASSVSVLHPKAWAAFSGGTVGKEYTVTWHGVYDDASLCDLTGSVLVQ